MMKLKLIAMSIVLLLIFVGYPKYKMMQQEDEIRAFLKGPFIEVVKKYQSKGIEFLNSSFHFLKSGTFIYHFHTLIDFKGA